MALSNWFNRLRPKVSPEDKAALAAMQQDTARQKEEAHGLLHQARTTGQMLAASRQRNHYRIILDEILGGKA
jgi:hypothetical protein